MYLKQLERYLSEKLGDIGFSRRDHLDIQQRFEKLKGSAMVPKSTTDTLRHLTFKEIAACIASLVSNNCNFAALSSGGLLMLKPVGGLDNAFYQCGTLEAALVELLTNSEARKCLLELRLTDDEIYTNSHGKASITYKSDIGAKVTYFVRGEAYSLMQTGAEESFDPYEVMTDVINEVSFTQRFFQKLVRRIDETKDVLPPAYVIKDAQSEDEKKLEDEKRKVLFGITPSSRFLNIGVDNQVTWPKEETLVEYDGYKLILKPKTKEHITSIHVDLHSQKLSMEEAETLVNRFLSMLTWCCDQYAVVQGSWAGNPTPAPVPKKNMAFTTAMDWAFYRNSPDSEVAKRALALYRQGRNAEQNYLVSSAVLSFYLILELQGQNNNTARNWIKTNFDKLRGIEWLSDRLASFESKLDGQSPEMALHDAYRTAVAHANAAKRVIKSDPDEATELERLHEGAEILRYLAREYIKNEFSVSTSYLK